MNPPTETPSSDTVDSPEPSPPGVGKSLLFGAATLVLLFLVIECGWRVVCWMGLAFPPTDDRSRQQEWEWIDPFLRGQRREFVKLPHRFDPVLGWVLAPGWVGVDERNGAVIHINSIGVRSTRGIPKKKQPGVPRLLCVGDSFTYGAMVDDEFAYPSILGEKYLDGWDVLNAGVSGYGIDQQVLFYERYGYEYEPDVVLMGFYIPDINRDNHWFYAARKPIFRIAGDDLVLATDHIRSPTDLLRAYRSGEEKIVTRGSYLLTELRWKWKRLRKRRFRILPEDRELTLKLLERFHRKVTSRGSLPFLLIIPHREILRHENTRSDEVAEILIQKCKELGMPYLNLAPALRRQAREDPQTPLYPPELTHHFSPVAAEVAAHSIYRSFVDWGILERFRPEDPIATSDNRHPQRDSSPERTPDESVSK